MSFLGISFLLALPLALVPVALHWFHRRRQVIIPWAAMRFLEDAELRGRNMRRVEEWILLAVRTLIVLLVVLALAQPVLQDGLSASLREQDVVLVVDTSLSMSQRGDDGRRPIDVMRTKARQHLRQLKAGSRVRILDSSGPVWRTSTPLVNTADAFGTLSHLIDELKVGEASSDMCLCLQAAVAAAQDEPGRPCGIVVFTDQQSHSWVTQDLKAWQTLSDAMSRSHTRPAVTIVDCATDSDQSRNLSVSELALEQSVLPTQTSAKAVATITNTGTTSSEPRQLTWLIDEQTVSETSLDALGPGVSRDVDFAHVIDEPGVFEIRCRIEGHDVLSGDDQAVAVVNVVSEIPVLVVGNDDLVRPMLSDVYFYMTALGHADHAGDPSDPFALPRGATSVYSPSQIPWGSLANEELYRYRCVILANPSSISHAVARKLYAYVNEGGGLWIALGEDTSPLSLNRACYQQGTGILPLPIGSMESGAFDNGSIATLNGTDDETAKRIHPPSDDHPATRLLGDLKRLDIDNVRVRRHQPFANWKQHDDLSVLLETTTGDPLAIERQLGQGRVIVQGIPFSPMWSNLPLTQSFVVMVRDWLQYLSLGGASPHNLQVGETITHDAVGTDVASSDIDVILHLPDQTQLTLAGRQSTRGTRYGFPAVVPGRYELELPDASIPYVVSRNPEESELTRLTQTQMDTITQTLAVPSLATNDSIAQRPPVEVPIAWILLLATLVFVVAELLYATVISRLRGNFNTDPVAFSDTNSAVPPTPGNTLRPQEHASQYNETIST